MYKLTKNIVCLQKNQICLSDAFVDNRSLAMTVQAELMKFGYMLDQDAFMQLGRADKADIVDFNNEVTGYLRYITGGDRNYIPFYPGFPQQVMDKSLTELWWDQIVSYWLNGKFVSATWTKPFESAFETVNYKMIKAGTEESFKQIFTDLVSVNQSITPQDMEVIKWFVDTKQPLVFPETIPFKENLCVLAAMGLDVPVKTPTDVLRIAVHMSGGDTSLPAVPKKIVASRQKVGYRYQIVRSSNPERKKFEFKKFKRAERKHILSLLEKTHCDAREMVLKDQRWFRLGEILHPGEYSKEFPKSANAFKLIRDTKVTSWYGSVEAAFKKSLEQGVQKLAERPGEFLRKLDYLLRKNGTKQRDTILKAFFEIAVKASNKVLFEVYTHFEGRNKPVTDRSVFIKGARKKTPLPNLPALPAETIQAVQDTIFQALKTKFALLEPMGDCWIDPELKKIPLPTNMRSMSESMTPIIRGQRLPIGDVSKTLRVFIHFPNKRHTGMTIDLSCVTLVNRGLTPVIVDWTHLKHSDMILHSGDSYGRVGNVAEYIDFDLQKLKAQGATWSLVQVNNFNKAAELVEGTVFGFCEVEHPNTNRQWLPETIINSMKVRIPAKTNLILIDLISNEYIFLDQDQSAAGLSIAQASDITTLVKNYGELPKYSVYDLLSWHVESRGRATSKEMAVTHFLYDDFKTSYTETLKYMGI